MVKKIRAYEAGQKMAKAIVEMAHLMYQNNTANHFYNGLLMMLITEKERRQAETFNTPIRRTDNIWPWKL